MAQGNKLLKIEVKGKQGKEWPNCKGIYGDNVMLVFVDFTGKGEFERPDFYILTVEDWIDFAKGVIAKYPDKKITLDKQNVLIWTTEKSYKGSGVKPEQIQNHKEQRSKIVEVVGQIADGE